MFYDVESLELDSQGAKGDPSGVVHVLAVGRKKGNVLRIGGKEVEL